MKYSISIFLTIIAAVIFYFAFWVACPYVTNLIPDGEWKGFLDLIVYCFVGYAGGVAFPLVLLGLAVAFAKE